MPDMDWLVEAEKRLESYVRLRQEEEHCRAEIMAEGFVRVSGPKLIAAVRLADKKAYEALQHVVAGQRGAAIARLDELVACLRSGEVNDA